MAAITWRRLLLATAALLVAFGIAELGARWIVWRNTPDGMVFRDDILYTFEPLSAPYGVQLNDIGCIGDDVADVTDGDLVVLLLGGSTSFSREYVDAVRDRLAARETEREVKVLSCGRPRYTSHINAVLLEELLPVVRPDVVVLYLGINDAIYNTFPWADDVPKVGCLDWRSPTESVLVGLARYHVVDKRLRSRPDFDADDLRSPAILRRSVEAVLASARASGARVVLATFALAWPTDDSDLRDRIVDQEPLMEHFWGRIESTVLAVRAHNQVLREVAAQHGVPLADVAAAMPRDGAHFGDLCHLTRSGNLVLGRAVAEACLVGDGEALAAVDTGEAL
jgi:lysophospholipase L1-like esterase